MEFLELLKVIQESIPPDYAWVSQAITDVFPWLVLGMSLLLCFFGYKVHRLWAVFLFFGLGFLAGVITGAFLVVAFPSLNSWILVALPVVLGALGAIFSKRLHKLQLFLVNSTLVYGALPGVLSRWLPETPSILVGLAAAIVVGLLAVKYKYIATIFTSAVSGALTAAPMILELVKVDSFPLLVALEGVLIAAGAALQFLMKKHESGKGKKAASPVTAAETAGGEEGTEETG